MPASIRSLPHPSKKRRTNLPSDSSLESHIKSLESTLTHAVQSSASLNPLIDLLDLALTATEPQDVSKALYALYRVFVILVGSGKLTAATGDDEAAKVVRAWLWDRLAAYGDLLASLMKDADAGLRVRGYGFPKWLPTDSLVVITDIFPPNSGLFTKTSLIFAFLISTKVSCISLQKDCTRLNRLSTFPANGEYQL